MTIKRGFSTSSHLHPASGIGDFRRKKHEKLCTAFPTLLPKAGASARSGLNVGKRLGTAAIQVFVGFYKNCAAIFYTDKNNINA
ncbi:hypothetical protein OC25_26580 [Pedobacter kyungheensis]|uniref:Uncharacterized protein n=1 Tax=Pedobacter kyungheensis TaxID=1069985 RepID=A0A0C1F281_9SPHI|nr:hypothetical protein OC25_26580 [Pedobacter kyungheensis]